MKWYSLFRIQMKHFILNCVRLKNLTKIDSFQKNYMCVKTKRIILKNDVLKNVIAVPKFASSSNLKFNFY